MKKSEQNIEKLFSFIKNYNKDNGYPPSVREMATYLNVKSTSTIAYYINKLEERGKIKKDPLKNRTINIIESSEVNHESNLRDLNYDSPVSDIPYQKMTNVPLLGNITAGDPILAHENHDEYITLPSESFGDSDIFALRVKGDSMINAGIFDGDKIIVKKQSHADNGQIVVALIDDEATVKRFYKEKNNVKLKPENDNMQPIIIPDVKILGKVVGLIRNM